MRYEKKTQQQQQQFELVGARSAATANNKLKNRVEKYNNI